MTNSSVALSKCGVHLALEDKDCAHVGIEKKDAALEAAMCEDVALLSPSFMFASSRFNRTIGSRDCMVRIAEVTDFDLTLAEDADTIARLSREARELRGVVESLERASGVASSQLQFVGGTRGAGAAVGGATQTQGGANPARVVRCVLCDRFSPVPPSVSTFDRSRGSLPFD